MPLHSMPNITGLQSKVQAQLTLSQAANTISILYPLLLILPKLPTANRSSTNRFTCGPASRLSKFVDIRPKFCCLIASVLDILRPLRAGNPFIAIAEN